MRFFKSHSFIIFNFLFIFIYLSFIWVPWSYKWFFPLNLRNKLKMFEMRGNQTANQMIGKF